MSRFPVGGSRENVYVALRGAGFVQSRHSDKEWHRADGLRINVYGAGSKARVHDKAEALLDDDELAMVLAKLGGFVPC